MEHSSFVVFDEDEVFVAQDLFTVADDKDFALNPYPGYRPYDTTDADLFFGREKQTYEVIEHLSAKHFTAVVGTSGTGKSSLIHAGVLPLLHGGYIFQERALWNIIKFQPGSSPIKNLAKELCRKNFLSNIAQGEELQITALNEWLHRSENALVQIYEQQNALNKSYEQSQSEDTVKQPKLLIFVDQFEELFRMKDERMKWEEETTAFIDLLLTAKEHKQIYLVITMRSDYIGHCSIFPELATSISTCQYLVPRMKREELEEAIAGPAKVAGAALSEQLVTQILNDAGKRADELPVLQHALMRTYEEWRKPMMQLKLAFTAGQFVTEGLEQNDLILLSEVYDNLEALVRRCWLGEDVEEILRNSALTEASFLRELLSSSVSIKQNLSKDERRRVAQILKDSIDMRRSNQTHRCIEILTSLDSNDILYLTEKFGTAYLRGLYKATKKITNTHYKRTGGWKRALDNHAATICDDNFNSAQDTKLLKSVFQSLTIWESDGAELRRPHTLTELSKITSVDESSIKRIIAPFRDPRCCFITPLLPKDLDAETKIDIGHESLIKFWDELNKWAKEEAKNKEKIDLAIRMQKSKFGMSVRQFIGFYGWYLHFKPNAFWAKQYGHTKEEYDSAIAAIHGVGWKSIFVFSAIAGILIGIAVYSFTRVSEVVIDNEDKSKKSERLIDKVENNKNSLSDVILDQNFVEAINCLAKGDLKGSRSFFEIFNAEKPNSDTEAILNKTLSEEAVIAYDEATGPQKTKLLYDATLKINDEIHDIVPMELRRILETVWAITGMFSDDIKTRVPARNVLAKGNGTLVKEKCFMPLLIQTCELNAIDSPEMDNALLVLSTLDADLLKKYKDSVLKIADLNRSPNLKYSDDLRRRLNAIGIHN